MGKSLLTVSMLAFRVGVAPACASNLAVAAPSPPLLPRPHNTRTEMVAISGDAEAMTRAVAAGAFSISTSEGMA